MYFTTAKPTPNCGMRSCWVGKDPQHIPSSAQSLVVCNGFWGFQVVLWGLPGWGTHSYIKTFFSLITRVYWNKIIKQKINKHVTLKSSPLYFPPKRIHFRKYSLSFFCAFFLDVRRHEPLSTSWFLNTLLQHLITESILPHLVD